MGSKYSKKDERDFYRSLGLCPRCGKNKLLGTERNCPECRSKSADYERKRYALHHDERLAQRNASFNRLYAERKAQGICVRCRKRKADKNHVTCTYCRKRDNLKAIERRKRKKDCVNNG